MGITQQISLKTSRASSIQLLGRLVVVKLANLKKWLVPKIVWRTHRQWQGPLRIRERHRTSQRTIAHRAMCPEAISKSLRGLRLKAAKAELRDRKPLTLQSYPRVKTWCKIIWRTKPNSTAALKVNWRSKAATTRMRMEVSITTSNLTFIRRPSNKKTRTSYSKTTNLALVRALRPASSWCLRIRRFHLKRKQPTILPLIWVARESWLEEQSKTIFR